VVLDVAIAIGHSRDSQGAIAVDGVSEWSWNRTLGALLVASLTACGLSSTVFVRPTSGTYKARMSALTAAVNAAAPRVAIELHFNATMNRERAGSEVLHYPGSVGGLAVAEALLGRVSAAVATKYTAPLRCSCDATGAKCPPQHAGAKTSHRVIAQARSWNSGGALVDVDGDGRPDPQGPPLYWLRDTACPAVILETHFGSNLIDHTNATRARDRGDLPRAIAEGLAAYLVAHPR
jgi:N-acetylmuramoyl-L-alanine amidase